MIGFFVAHLIMAGYAQANKKALNTEAICDLRRVNQRCLSLYKTKNP
jgi:uncharacterized protein YicC (UPF0701 family)